MEVDLEKAEAQVGVKAKVLVLGKERVKGKVMGKGRVKVKDLICQTPL